VSEGKTSNRELDQTNEQGEHDMMIKVSDLTPEELAFYNSIQVKRTWGAFEAFWAKLGEVAYLTEKRDNIQAEINKIRAEFVKVGRKPGYSPKAAAAAKRAETPQTAQMAVTPQYSGANTEAA
jgi:hypothetical protein